MDSIAISKFKATCLAVIEKVRTSGRPIVITKRGIPVAQLMPPTSISNVGRQFGGMEGTATIAGDLVSPIVDEGEWEVLVEPAP